MAYTLLSKICRKSRLEATLNQPEPGDDCVETMAALLDQTPVPFNTPSLISIETTKIAAKAKKLEDRDYLLLLHYLRNTTGQYWREYWSLPHPDGSLVLPFFAQMPADVTINGMTFSRYSSHDGNGVIQFYLPQNLTIRNSGRIQHIWQVPLEGHLRTFFVVQPFVDLSQDEQEQTPYFDFPRFYTQVYDAAPSPIQVILEPHHIRGHVSVVEENKGAFGIERPLLLVNSALGRQRKKYIVVCT